MNNKQTIGISVFGIILACIILGLFYVSQTNTPPDVTNTSPQANTISQELYPDIFVSFDQNIKDPDQYTFSITPPLQGQTTHDNTTNTLIFQPTQRVIADTTYQISVTYKEKIIQEWYFNTPPSDTSGEYINKRTDFTTANYPLIDVLPRETNTYTINYTDRRQLEITTDQDPQTIRQEIESWIVHYGVDPATHELLFATPE